MGYPSKQEGMEILKRFKQLNPLDNLKAVIDTEAIISMQKVYSEVEVSEDVLHYLMDLIEKTRNHEAIVLGVSPRGSQAF